MKNEKTIFVNTPQPDTLNETSTWLDCLVDTNTSLGTIVQIIDWQVIAVDSPLLDRLVDTDTSFVAVARVIVRMKD